MTRDELLKKHEHYSSMVANWNLCMLAYNGGEDFIKYAIGEKNPLESQGNYNVRIKEGINFNYVEAIIDLFNFYLTEKTPIRRLPFLKDDVQWQMFLKDSDLQGTDFDMFITDSQKIASCQGAIGLLVDKPSVQTQTKEQEIQKHIYPYLVPFSLPNIYDFKYAKDPLSGRPKLIYLKLKSSDDTYYIWTPGTWQIWKDSFENKKKDPILINSGTVTFNEIPFIWFQNLKNVIKPYFGKSDVTDISRIVASIIRNVSMGEEVIKFAGFPMMRKPMSNESEDTKTETGPEAVHQFDPTFGEGGKPDWMKTAIQEPIEAILAWIDRKVDEIYRVTHLSGVHGQRKSNNEVASGLALRYEYQQLTSVLTKKANNMAEAERDVVRFFCMWQNIDYSEDDAEIKHKKDFSVDDLSINLDNLIKSMRWVASNKFRVLSQQYIAKHALPDLPEKDKDDVAREIEASQGKIPDDDKEPTNQLVRSATDAAQGGITKPDPEET